MTLRSLLVVPSSRCAVLGLALTGSIDVWFRRNPVPVCHGDGVPRSPGSSTSKPSRASERSWSSTTPTSASLSSDSEGIRSRTSRRSIGSRSTVTSRIPRWRASTGSCRFTGESPVVSHGERDGMPSLTRGMVKSQSGLVWSLSGSLALRSPWEASAGGQCIVTVVATLLPCCSVVLSSCCAGNYRSLGEVQYDSGEFGRPIDHIQMWEMVISDGREDVNSQRRTQMSMERIDGTHDGP